MITCRVPFDGIPRASKWPFFYHKPAMLRVQFAVPLLPGKILNQDIPNLDVLLVRRKSLLPIPAQERPAARRFTAPEKRHSLASLLENPPLQRDAPREFIPGNFPPVIGGVVLDPVRSFRQFRLSQLTTGNLNDLTQTHRSAPSIRAAEQPRYHQ